MILLAMVMAVAVEYQRLEDFPAETFRNKTENPMRLSDEFPNVDCSMMWSYTQNAFVTAYCWNADNGELIYRWDAKR